MLPLSEVFSVLIAMQLPINTGHILLNTQFNIEKVSLPGYDRMMVTTQSSVIIYSSTFSKNRAEYAGGIMMSYYQDSIGVISSTFSNNYLTSSGGVMVASQSSLKSMEVLLRYIPTIIHSTLPVVYSPTTKQHHNMSNT